jgi:hypothetical protein
MNTNPMKSKITIIPNNAKINQIGITFSKSNVTMIEIDIKLNPDSINPTQINVTFEKIDINLRKSSIKPVQSQYLRTYAEEYFCHPHEAEFKKKKSVNLWHFFNVNHRPNWH